MTSSVELPLEPQLEQYIRQFEDAKATIRELTAGLTEEQFNQRPSQDSWSVGEVVDHLCILAKLVLQRMEERIEYGRKKGILKPGPYRYDWLSRFAIKLVGKPAPNKKKRRLPAPKIYVPGRTMAMTSKIEEFVNVQDTLGDCARRANGLNIAKIKVASPETILVRISIGGWLEAIASHQLRHFDQIRNVRAALGVK